MAAMGLALVIKGSLGTFVNVGPTGSALKE